MKSLSRTHSLPAPQLPLLRMMCLILVEPPVELFFHPRRCHSEQLPPKYLLSAGSAGAFFSSVELERACVSPSVCEECVGCVQAGGVSDGPDLVVNYRKGGGHEITVPEPPLFFCCCTDCSSSAPLVIMAVLPHSCLFGAGPNRKKVGVW